MEKISISANAFEELVDKFHETFMKCPYSGCKKSSAFALKALLFDVKEFKEDGWNDCDVEVPSEFHCRDLLIRLKNIAKDNNGNTVSCSDYKVGYFEDCNNEFVYHDGDCLVGLDNLDKYEYKLIK